MAILNTLHLNGLRHAAQPRLAVPRLASLGAMLDVIRTRRQLARLDDRMLKDIGISRADALAEASRAPWDLSRRVPIQTSAPEGASVIGTPQPAAPGWPMTRRPDGPQV